MLLWVGFVQYVKGRERKGMERLKRLKRWKADMIVSALVCVVLGVVLLIWPGETIDIFCKVLAIGLIIMGVVNILNYFMNKSIHPFGGVMGTVVALVGVWIFASPERIVSLVPIVIGVVLCIHGIQDMKLAFETRENGYEKWWTMMIVAVISLVFGIICISKAFGMVTLALQFIGIGLIYDGLSDLWVASQAVRMERAMKREADVLEVEYKEVNEEEEK